MAGDAGEEFEFLVRSDKCIFRPFALGDITKDAVSVPYAVFFIDGQRTIMQPDPALVFSLFSGSGIRYRKDSSAQTEPLIVL